MDAIEGDRDCSGGQLDQLDPPLFDSTTLNVPGTSAQEPAASLTLSVLSPNGAQSASTSTTEQAQSLSSQLSPSPPLSSEPLPSQSLHLPSQSLQLSQSLTSQRVSAQPEQRSRQAFVPITNSPAADTSSSKKNFIWQSQDVQRLVSILHGNESFQLCLLPSRENDNNDPTNRLRKNGVFRDIFKQIFPSSNPVEPERIKFKVRWLKKTYYEQQKKLGLTGAGFLEDMDSTDPAFASRAAIAAKHPWFPQFHEMMNDRPGAAPSALITTPPLAAASDDDEAVNMEICNDDVFGDDHAPHGRGLPNLDDMLDRTTSSNATSQPATSTPSTITRLSLSNSPGPSLFSVPSTPTASGGIASMMGGSTSTGKRKRGGIEQKRDSIADAYYQSQKNTMEMRLALEKERTRREEVRLHLEKVKADREKEREQRDRDALNKSQEAIQQQTAAMVRMHQDNQQMLTNLVSLLAARLGSDSSVSHSRNA